MARRPTQLRVAAILAVVVVAMAATATGAARRRVRPPPPPEEDIFNIHFDIRVDCTDVHGVRAGETCGSVARDASITLPVFMELNPNVTCGSLFPGQWVCVNGIEVG